VPRLGDQAGVIDVTGDATSDTPGDVVVRGLLPFQAWAVGGGSCTKGRIAQQTAPGLHSRRRNWTRSGEHAQWRTAEDGSFGAA
jgi:hypothetical protein